VEVVDVAGCAQRVRTDVIADILRPTLRRRRRLGALRRERTPVVDAPSDALQQPKQRGDTFAAHDE
jgi:hypothetical protein